MHSGLVERTTTASITFPKAGAAASVATRSGMPDWLHLIGAGIVALVLALAPLFLVLRRRRRVDRLEWNPAMPTGARHAAQRT